MEKIKSAEAQRRREGAPVAQSRGRTLREPNRRSVQEGSAPGGRGGEPQKPRGGHGLGVSVHASLTGGQGLGAEYRGRPFDSHRNRAGGGQRWEVNKTTSGGDRALWPRCGEGKGLGRSLRQYPGWGTGSPALRTAVMPRRAQSSELARHRHLRGQSPPPWPRNTAITCQNENTATCVYAETTAVTAQRLSGMCLPTPLALTTDPCSLTLHAAHWLRACGCLTVPPRLGRLHPLPLRGCCRDAGRQGQRCRGQTFLEMCLSRGTHH